MSEGIIGCVWLCGSNSSEQAHFVRPLGHLLGYKVVYVCGCAQGSSQVGSPRTGYIDVSALKSSCCIGMASFFGDQPGFRGVWEVAIVWAQPGQFIPPFPEVLDVSESRSIICIPYLSGWFWKPLDQGNGGHGIHWHCQWVPLCGAFLGVYDFAVYE